MCALQRCTGLLAPMLRFFKIVAATCGGSGDSQNWKKRWEQIRNRPPLNPFLISVHRFHSKSFKKAMVLLSSFAHLVCQAVAPPPTVIALVKRRVGRF